VNFISKPAVENSANNQVHRSIRFETLGRVGRTVQAGCADLLMGFDLENVKI
jgi:hypothetical protein